jgi:plastocyanin
MLRLLVLIPVGLLLTACGGSSSAPSGQAGGTVLQTVQISEKEYSLTPGTVNVPKTGTYAFKVTNHGTTAHALEVEGNGVEEKTASIQPGSTTTLKVTLSKDGSYDMYCPIDGHRAQGMQGTIFAGNGTGSSGQTTTGQTTTATMPGY